MMIEQILMNLKAYCEERDGNCYGCQYASDKDNNFECIIQHITGNYPAHFEEAES